MSLEARLTSCGPVWSHISTVVFHCGPTFISGGSGSEMCREAVKAWPKGTEMKAFLGVAGDLKISEGRVRQIGYY